MSQPMPATPTPAEASAALFRACLEQIASESAFLDELGDALRAIGVAIGGGFAALGAAHQLQEVTAERAAAMKARRTAWREEIASCLGVHSDDVTVAAVAARCAPAAQRNLLDARERLHAKVHAVARLNGANAFLVRAYLEALQRFFLDLTGAGEASGRYGRAGVQPAPVYGSLVRLEG